MDQLKTSIRSRVMRNRRGVLIKSEKSSANTEPGEDGRAVPAAAKGAIDVHSVGTDSEGVDGFFEENRDMDDLTHGGKDGGAPGTEGPLLVLLQARNPGSPGASQREVLHPRGQHGVAAGGETIELLLPALEVPDFVVAALPDEHHALVDAGERAQLG